MPAAAPLSFWHVVLGWADLATDLIGAVSTLVITRSLQELCGMNLRPYFVVCFVVQLALLIGNLTAQASGALGGSGGLRPVGGRPQQHVGCSRRSAA